MKTKMRKSRKPWAMYDGKTRAQHIREYQTEHPEASPREIEATLQARGIPVTASYISTLRYHDSVKAEKQDVSLDDLDAASELVKEVNLPANRVLKILQKADSYRQGRSWQVCIKGLEKLADYQGQNGVLSN